MSFTIPQSTAYVVMFKAYLASDHVSEATGKTIAITISKNGAAFAAASAGNATEVSSGWYKVTLDTTDTNTVGPIAIRGAVATVDDVGLLYNVVKATNGGLTALPDAAANAAGGLIISTAGALNADQQRADVAAILVDTGTTLDGRLPAALVSGRMDASVGGMQANVITAAATDPDFGNEMADAILNRDMSVGTDSGSATFRTMRQALRFLRNKWSIAGTTMTVTKENDTTTSWTSELTGTAGADPVTASDPASS